MNVLQQGGIYLFRFNPNKGQEIGKLRPAAVLTNQLILDREPGLLFVCPLSRYSHQCYEGLHVDIFAREHLRVDSYALVEHCRSVSIKRCMGNRLASLNRQELNLIIRQLSLLVNVN